MMVNTNTNTTVPPAHEAGTSAGKELVLPIPASFIMPLPCSLSRACNGISLRNRRWRLIQVKTSSCGFFIWINFNPGLISWSSSLPQLQKCSCCHKERGQCKRGRRSSQGEGADGTVLLCFCTRKCLWNSSLKTSGFYFLLFRHNRITYTLRLLNIKATTYEIVLNYFSGPHTYPAGIYKIFVTMLW